MEKTSIKTNTTTKDKTGFTSAELEEKFLKITKHTAKDSVFRDLFGNTKYLLELYQILHPEDTDIKEEDLNIVTIKNILLDQMYNDLGFRVRDRLVILVEAQSTWSLNILVRGFLYLAQTWQEYIQETRQNVYKSKKIVIPKPELYVIYTGNRKNVPEWISLSEEFFGGESKFADLGIRVLTCGEEGDIIDQYIKFTRVFNDQVKIYGYTRKAVMETIGICKNKNVLKEYLKSREKEVVDIMSILFDDEYIMRLYVEDKVQEAREEAEKELKEAAKKAAKEAVKKATKEATEKVAKEAAEEAKRKNREMTKKLFSMGMDVQKIADVIDVEPSQVEEWIREDQSEECVIKK